MRIQALRLKGLKQITLPISNGSYSPLDLAVDPSDKYILDSVDGLGPGDVNVAIATVAGGGKYQGRELVPRQIILNLKLNPNWWKDQTVEELRTELYHMLSTGYDPSVLFQLIGSRPPTLHGDPEVIAQTVCYASRIVPVHFSKDPMVQITLDCLDAQFKDPKTSSIKASQLNRTRPAIENIGSAEAGFKMSVKFTDTMNSWHIKVAEHQAWNMVFDMTFHDGDVLEFSTIPGSTYIHWNKRRGKVTNKMGILTNASEWLTLHPGVNHFVCPSVNKWHFRGDVIYTPLYWGV